ncbi:MAG: sigma-54-dependent Fis family transcriptional regulator [Planctomycetes bacterium]|nr:sigma-54-dependent Fis family transcriptional regulator [Planctomycetota bacterium]
MSEPTGILIVDDEESMRDACRQVLTPEGFAVTEAASGDEAMEAMRRESFDLAILDLKMPRMDGLDILRWIRQESPGTAAVVITGYPSVESAVEAMKCGAADFLPKPFTPDVLRLTVRRTLREVRMLRENLLLRSQLEECQGGRYELVGQSEPMRQIHDLVRRVAPTDSTVLITGESGTGKELIARAIRDNSPRADKPFVTVDCGSLVGTLFESELFGHVKGSFTGATGLKHGRVELADGGTIFFDEIANVSPDIQAKLLRLIQEREFARVGATQIISVDVRILAATSRNLLDEIREGRFREDLFYRLCVVPVVLPPLRQRREDIPLLAEHFLRKHADCRRERVHGFTQEAMDALQKHDWPGNVRELENAIERALVLAQGDRITLADLLYYGVLTKPDAAGAGPTSLADIEKEHIAKVLRRHGGNRSAAARALEIDRKTLWRKMREYGLTG